jgi:plastocyanin
MKGTPAVPAMMRQFHCSLRNLAGMAMGVVLALRMAACDSSEQTVRIVAQDFVFTPAEVRVSALRPIRLTIVNEGREPHEFKSALLAHQTEVRSGASSSLPVLPNHTAEAVIRTIPGVYLFYCAMRGHAGMSGTIIVE